MNQISGHCIKMCFLIGVLLLVSCAANRSHISPATQRLIGWLEKPEAYTGNGDSLQVNAQILRQYPVEQEASGPVIAVVLNAENDFQSQWLDELGISYRKKTDRLYVLRCPLSELKTLAELDHVHLLEVDTRGNP